MRYLDNAATSFPKPDIVIQAINHCLKEIGANPGRGQHGPALEAGRIVLRARQALSRLLGAANPADIVLTANATEGLNLAIKGLLAPGATVLTTGIEHNAVLRPLAYLEEKVGIKIIYARHKADTGEIDLGQFERQLRSADLAVVTHASNVIGTILPLAEMVKAANRAKVPIIVDAAQTVGLVPINVEALGVDVLVFTGHKALLGPQGTGGLYIRPDLEVEELKHGGTGGETKDKQPTIKPDRYECGTPNTPGIAGLGAAAQYINDRGIGNIYREEQGRIQTLLTELSRIKNVTIYGPPRGVDRVPLVSLTIDGLPVHRVAARLDREFQIAARAGWHCAPAAHRVLGTYQTGTLRLSLSAFSADDDIVATVAAISAIAAQTR